MTVPEPSVCPRCGGEGWVLLQELTTAVGWLVEVYCPECRCVACGKPTTYGLCEDCEAVDWVAGDTAARRAER